MLLVPKQLRRAGMTGDVPYYGGRLTPAQAYAASHRGPPPRGGDAGARRPVPPASSVTDQTDTLLALQHLLDRGVITPEEYRGLRARVRA